jgi:hypothetical protein
MVAFVAVLLRPTLTRRLVESARRHAVLRHGLGSEWIDVGGGLLIAGHL